jgi:hypothetical protein
MSSLFCEQYPERDEAHDHELSIQLLDETLVGIDE